ncbi:MAG: toll/interleukin-1 receptor domain-containing protein [Hyphomonadaceae bacterium]|nr:toll/interleukin-1 receptor domain-containing protein [Hyphomonadaceae bacterium]
MADVFISYTRDDKERVHALAEALQARGIDVWWDPELVPGDQYAQKIKTVLAEAKVVVVAWSKASIERGWVLDEAAVGRDRGVLAPVLLDADLTPPLGFRQIQAVDLSRWPGIEGEAAFEELVAAIARLRGAPAKASAASSPRARLMRRIAIYGGGAALVAIAVIALSQIVNGPSTPPRDEAELGEGPPPEGSTDAPGADELYGFAPDEVRAYAPVELIQLALQRTSIEMIEAGARAGDPLGQTLLCLGYAFGEGIAADANAARAQCEAASAAGDALATYQLSALTRAADPAEADVLLRRARDGGDPRAQTDVGLAHLAAGEDGQALDLLRRAADQGYLPAQVALAGLYRDGRGAVRDAQEAMRWCQQAAEGGSPAGLRCVGVLYETGEGVGQDFERARAQYEIAAELGDAEAARRLAGLYERGEGGPADLTRARALYLRAADLGDAEARAAVSRLDAAP